MKKRGFALVLILLITASTILLASLYTTRIYNQSKVPARLQKKRQSEYYALGLFQELIEYEKAPLESFILSNLNRVVEEDYEPKHRWENKEPDKVKIIIPKHDDLVTIKLVYTWQDITSSIHAKISYIPEFAKNIQLIMPDNLTDGNIQDYQRFISRLNNLKTSDFNLASPSLRLWINEEDTYLDKIKGRVKLKNESQFMNLIYGTQLIFYNNNDSNLFIGKNNAKGNLALMGVLISYGDIHIYEDFKFTGFVCVPEGNIICHNNSRFIVDGVLIISNETNLNDLVFSPNKSTWKRTLFIIPSLAELKIDSISQY